ncbi:MAG TPA: TonB-dependent receptor, partial [Terriglobales bacterium]|nr:TonB-dependent receptor [Terriglobales bacterium]
DRLWFFAGFAPYFQSLSRAVDFKGNGGVQTFTQDQKSYFGTTRLDAQLTQKIRVFGSWLTQGVRSNGVNLPDPDSLQGFTNSTISTPLTNYSHSLGFSAPNQTVSVGADYTVTPRIVSTTRFGYFFENYHDFGWPTAGTDYSWRTTGLPPATDYAGNPFPAALQQAAGTETTPFSQNYTVRNANKHWQFNQDVAMFKSGLLGTHNFKFGYQYNQLSNDINQNGNVPYVRLYLHRPWSPLTGTGVANCAALKAQNGACAGQEGYLRVQDFTTQGSATDTNHALYFQDAWTIGKGLTINAGLRVEKEQIPAPAGNVLAGHTIDFSWGDKIEPRVGLAWDPLQNGRMKVFASYGVVNDVMKLLLAMTSFGGQAYEECAYALGPQFNPATASATFVNGRACPSAAATVGANWTGGTVPAGLSLIENVNLRPFEPVAPGVKPYRQHESAFGVDVQLSKNYSLETRWDRRRLDHVLEDASLTDVNWGETYTIVNPGEGVNRTLNGYANYLGSLGEVFGVPGWAFDSAAFGTCNGCPNNPKAYRSYDGLEFRLSRASSNRWSGSFSYTYSRLRGNYTGLTTTEQLDGSNPGRNSPDTSRAFDEPTAYLQANGSSSNGLLPTDRPNTFKGYVFYNLHEGHRNTTTIGLFQTAYQGTPKSTYMDVGGALPGQPSYAQYIFGRDKWLDPSQISIDPSNGAITLGNPTTSRTPWFVQSDINLKHEIKVSSADEAKSIAFECTLTNAFNQHAVTAYYMGMNSTAFATSLSPGSDLNQGALGYQTIERGYSLQQWINSSASPITVSSQYGKPSLHQLPRTMRLKVSYRF